MKRGFTLIELLVCVAVIGLLAAIIVPSVSIVQARAESANCLGNLRSLGVALNSYLAENQMRMPVMEAGRADKSEDVPVLDNTLDPYLDSKKVLLCPSDGKIGAESGTSYYWNSTLNGQALASLRFLIFSPDHSRIPVLVDKEGWHRKTKEKVNHLFADGHATNELRLFSD